MQDIVYIGTGNIAGDTTNFAGEKEFPGKLKEITAIPGHSNNQ